MKYSIYLIVALVLLLVVIIIVLVRNNSKPKINAENFTDNILAVGPTITANWYLGDSKSSFFPESTYIKQDSPVGLALSGGGSRAMCCTWGVLQSLNDNNLLNNDAISYISANSGSTWGLLSTLYQPIEGSKYTISEILGTTNLETLNLNSTINTPLLGYNAVNSSFEIGTSDKWWCYDVGKNFFEPYGLDTLNSDGYSNGIVGIDDKSVNNIMKQLGPNSRKYKGITLRKNMPIPIALETAVNQIVIRFAADLYFGLPFDSTPVSSGFLTNNLVSSTDSRSKMTNIGGRIDSFAFNSLLKDPPTPITKKGIQKVNVQLQYDTWDPIQMSGTSSMAAGFDMTKQMFIDRLVPIYTVNQPNVKPINPNINIVDGASWDNTAATSLFARKVKKMVIFAFNSLEPSQWENPESLQDIKNLFGADNDYYPTYHGVTLAQVLDNTKYSDGTTPCSKTITSIIENYKKTGIGYYSDKYKTFRNPLCGTEVYEAEIMWYVLAPCPKFMSILSASNQKRADKKNMPRGTNPCTIQPYLSDCFEYPKTCNATCDMNLMSIYNLISSGTTSTSKITDAQALLISSQMYWTMEQVILPFLKQ